MRVASFVPRKSKTIVVLVYELLPALDFEFLPALDFEFLPVLDFESRYYFFEVSNNVP